MQVRCFLAFYGCCLGFYSLFLKFSDEAGYIFGSVDFCQLDYSKNCKQILVILFGGVRCCPKKKWLDVGGNPGSSVGLGSFAVL